MRPLICFFIWLPKNTIQRRLEKKGQENYEKLIDLRDELFALDGTPRNGSEKGYRIWPKH